MIIIAGLGNPTDKYRGTRHNVGFDAIDRIAKDNDILVETYRHKALCGKGIIGGQKVLIMKMIADMIKQEIFVNGYLMMKRVRISRL